MSVNLISRLGLEQARLILGRSFAQYQANQRADKKNRKVKDLASRFDQVVEFLSHIDYLTKTDEGVNLQRAGLVLSRLHTEQDLLLAEAIRTGIFDGLAPAGLAAVASCVVYEPRRESSESFGRLPPEPISSAIIDLAHLAEKLHELEHGFGLNYVKPIEAGLARPMWRWANGASLAQILGKDDFTVGDFFRWARQSIDFLIQIGRASEGTALAKNCEQAVLLIDRGVVAMAGNP
jgi:ATP-dependent RNA helicase HelY